MAISYSDAGVNIDEANRAVARIKRLVRNTFSPDVLTGIGSFGAAFRLRGLKQPVLISSADGVGTKLKVAIAAQRHNTIGEDLVNHCVNDIMVQGAEPLFFLDYFAVGKLDVAVAKDVIGGIARACRDSGCALIGGETAEMPGMYHGNDYDLAGFAVGAVERGEILPSADIVSGDVLIGLHSSGVHSNGYSLVRKLVANAKLGWHDPAPFAHGQSVAEALLTPTRLYVKPILAALKATGGGGPEGAIKALSHITGGGISENLPRVLPPSVAARINLTAWTPPPVFGWLAKAGRLDEKEMLRTFNCGLGMIVVARKARAGEVMAALAAAGETPVVIGEITPPSGEKSSAKGKGDAWAVGYDGRLGLQG